MITRRLYGSSICIFVLSRLLTSKMLLFISAGSRSTNKRGNLIFSILLRTFVTERTENPISFIAVLISIGVVDGCMFRMTILNALSSFI